MHGVEKEIGEINEDTYFTTRKPNHYMRIFQGFGISVCNLKRLQEIGIKKVQITYIGKSIEKYSCPLDKFLTSEKEYNYHGTDLQKFVSIKDMEKLQ
jgi:hypothetical protein